MLGLGFQLTDLLALVPAGTVQEMVHKHGPDKLRAGMRALAAHYGLAADEHMTLMITEVNNTVLIVPMALPHDLDVTKARKFPYRDLCADLGTIPLVAMLDAVKELNKAGDAIADLEKAMAAASEKGNTEKLVKLGRQRDVLKEREAKAAQVFVRFIAPQSTAAAPEPAALTESTQTEANEGHDDPTT